MIFAKYLLQSEMAYRGNKSESITCIWNPFIFAMLIY